MVLSKLIRKKSFSKWVTFQAGRCIENPDGQGYYRDPFPGQSDQYFQLCFVTGRVQVHFLHPAQGIQSESCLGIKKLFWKVCNANQKLEKAVGKCIFPGHILLFKHAVSTITAPGFFSRASRKRVVFQKDNAARRHPG